MVKKLIIINGTMGVGKSIISKALNQKLHNSVWLDGDWCWMMSPWNFTDENKAMVLDNISYILNNYIKNQSFEYIIFSWVIPSDAVMEMVLERLDLGEIEVFKFTLLCSENALISRMKAGGRSEEGITGSISRLQGYASMDTVKIDTSEKSVESVTSIIIEKILAENTNVFLKLETPQMEYFLKETEIIDNRNKEIMELSKKHCFGNKNEIDIIRTVYEYIRDEISHSMDIGAEDIIITASGVLKAGHGLCYAKSHLMAAILRYLGIPTGFCYQLLKGRYGPVLHGLNAVYLKDLNKWIRLDASGNKPGIDAKFSTDKEYLAYPPGEDLIEDSDIIFCKPWEELIRVLNSKGRLSEVIPVLPASLPVIGDISGFYAKKY